MLKEHSFLDSVIDFCSDRLTYTLNSYQVLCNQIRAWDPFLTGREKDRTVRSCLETRAHTG